PLGFCGLGCFGVIGLAAVVFSVAYSFTGRYQPAIQPPKPVPADNGFDDFVAAGRMLAVNGGTKALYPAGRTDAPPSLAAEQLVVAQNQAALARLRMGLPKQCRVSAKRSFTALYPYLAEFRDLARLLQAEQHVSGARGDYARAFSAG